MISNLKLKLKKNEVADLIRFLRSYNKLDEKSNPTKITTNLVKELRIEEMRDRAVIGPNRYLPARQSIIESTQLTQRQLTQRQQIIQRGTGEEAAPWGFKKNGQPKRKPDPKTKFQTINGLSAIACKENTP